MRRYRGIDSFRCTRGGTFPRSRTCDSAPPGLFFAQSFEQQRHHFLCQVVIERGMAYEQPKDSRAINHVENKLPINLLVDLSTLDAAIKNRSRSFAPGLKKSFTKKRRKFLVGFAFRN